MTYDEMTKKVRRGTTTLFVLAAIFFVFGFIYYGMNQGGELAGALLWTNLILGVVFIALGFWSKNNPLAAQISGLVLFVLVQLLAIFEDPSNIVKGIIMKVVVIVFLIRGIVSAMEAEKFRKAHNIS